MTTPGQSSQLVASSKTAGGTRAWLTQPRGRGEDSRLKRALIHLVLIITTIIVFKLLRNALQFPYRIKSREGVTKNENQPSRDMRRSNPQSRRLQ